MPEGTPTAVTDSWEETGGAASRPSKTNLTSDTTDADAPENDVPPDWRRRWWRRKNEVVDAFLDAHPAKAARPVSVRGGEKIREDAALARDGDGGYRSATWSSVVREFCTWYNGYRHAHLRFRNPEGKVVRTPMKNSHQPSYGNKYYARLKALERAVVDEWDDLHVVMLTLTGSTKNANDGWRCPADHLLDVKSSWLPDRGRGVYHALRDVLGGERWEYAMVNEHHKSGYGHQHVAVFVDGEVEEADFRPVIDAHLRECSIAAREAHDYHHPEPEKRPISVREVDTTLDAVDAVAGEDDAGPVTNIGSYIAEYIGAHGEELFDREPAEIAHRAVCWATGTQRVRFSNGANELIDAELDSDANVLRKESTGWKRGTTEEDLREAVDDDEQSVADYVDGERDWSLEGIGRVDEDGEDVFKIDRAGVEWVALEDASHLDPPAQQPASRPRPRTSSTDLGTFASTD